MPRRTARCGPTSSPRPAAAPSSGSPSSNVSGSAAPRPGTVADLGGPAGVCSRARHRVLARATRAPSRARTGASRRFSTPADDAVRSPVSTRVDLHGMQRMPRPVDGTGARPRVPRRPGGAVDRASVLRRADWVDSRSVPRRGGRWRRSRAAVRRLHAPEHRPRATRRAATAPEVVQLGCSARPTVHLPRCTTSAMAARVSARSVLRRVKSSTARGIGASGHRPGTGTGSRPSARPAPAPIRRAAGRRDEDVHRSGRARNALHAVEVQRVETGENRTVSGVEQRRQPPVRAGRRPVAQQHDAR